MLQRLGLQYKGQKREKVGDKLKKQWKSGETIDVPFQSITDSQLKVQVELEIGGKEDEATNPNSSFTMRKEHENSVIKNASEKSKQSEKSKKEKSKKIIDKNKTEESIPGAPVAVKPVEIVNGPISKQAVVKKINLQGGESDEEEESETDVEMEGVDSSESEESEDEGGDDGDDKDDGLSAFFLNSDGTSRNVITSEMKDVEEEEEDKGRVMIRGRGMRGAREAPRSAMWGRGKGNEGKARGMSDARRGMKRGMDRGGGRGRGEMRGGQREKRVSRVVGHSTAGKKCIHRGLRSRDRRK
ncbi:hypothetical protein PMAYCL1PPCAC_23681 [Pristionchus mayeri]|uniref:Uncharacterized protein n=1 Tax=Pristionchus mayeri TaxID=1317129 RepID=A0AAN5CZA0_9BILA|nr:hypothetical protein PMAYCL1PPCAC_23681 [Pristionchus mayeri]